MSSTPSSPPSSAYERLWRSPPPYASPASVRSPPSSYDSDSSSLPSRWSLSSESTLRRPSARQRDSADNMLVKVYPPLVPTPRSSPLPAKGTALEDRLTDRHRPDALGRRVLIGPLRGVSSTELASLLLSRVGPVNSLTVDRRGNAIVQFAFGGTAGDARKKLHGLVLDGGNRISVVVLPEEDWEERERKRPRLSDQRKC
ncbi:uncharacterized protein LOC62_05G007133 [Vanrija pseudolonga]|uniref:RRM domain-containing protein n=1 Tax=Vanrija pseudolonga TaxID=143232 RepID=A0AAF0YBA2_9TREE|nr:hypothetical protein LOC62_05G007133 [Vanrija pseudolonga]